MAVHLIPLAPGVYNYTFGVALDNIQYSMHVYWNDKDAAWFFDLSTAAGRAIATGIKIVLGAFLGRTINEAPFSTGVIAAVDSSGAEKDAGLDDMGSRVLLYYVPATDLLANAIEYHNKTYGTAL